MYKIFVLYYEGKYTRDYVDKLYRSLKRNCSVDFTFIAYSDTPVLCDQQILLTYDLPIKAHWHKLRFFDEGFTGSGEIIVMDIDQIILKDITEMITYPCERNEIVSYDKWWTDSRDTTINGGWYKFHSGDFQYVWKKYYSDMEKWQNYYFDKGVVHFRHFGEQNFVEDTIRENGGKVTLMPGQWVCKYTKDFDNNRKINMRYIREFGEQYLILGDEFNENVKVVHFANPDNDIHNNEYKWIQDYWR